AQVADDRDVLIATHDAAVGFLVELDAAATAIFRRLAGDLRCRERTRQRKLRVGNRCDTSAQRQLDLLAVVYDGRVRDLAAQTLHERLRRVQGRLREEQREAI